MQIPPQEDWSLELLNELQRAVPVLESSSFHLGDEDDANLGVENSAHGEFGSASASSDGWMSPRNEGWSSQHNSSSSAAADGSAHHLLGEPETSQAASGSVELFSDDAWALPMTTLTSGKRKTYPNKSTFQAHVCCVMDPSQVPHVLQTLQGSANFRSVQHWPYAYRIISPFDGQAHEGSCDGEDAGAGEKMLALLTRMGLENLLLIVSRWDTGPPNRLGSELFKCLNEQCKELLRELQQAVRASFPPEELLRPDFVQLPDGGSASQHEAAQAATSTGDGLPTMTQCGGDTFCTDDDSDMRIWANESTDADCCATMLAGTKSGHAADNHAGRLFDLGPLGSSAQVMPKRYWATRNVFSRPVRLRREAQIAALRRAALQDEVFESGEGLSPLQKNAVRAARGEAAVGMEPTNQRAGNCRQDGAQSVPTATSGSVDTGDDVTDMRLLYRKTLEAPSCVIGPHGPAGVGSPALVSDVSEDEEEAALRQCGVMARMTSEELLRFGAQLRVDRLGLEERLGTLSKASDVIRNMATPLLDGCGEQLLDKPATPGKSGKRGTNIISIRESIRESSADLSCMTPKSKVRSPGRNSARSSQMIRKSQGSDILRQAGNRIFAD